MVRFKTTLPKYLTCSKCKARTKTGDWKVVSKDEAQRLLEDEQQRIAIRSVGKVIRRRGNEY